MKILIIGPAYPYRGGIASYNERLALEFQNQGHEVLIYTFSLQYPSFLFPGKTQFSVAQPPKELTILRKINAIQPLNWIKVGKEIRKIQPDFVLVRYWLPFIGISLGTILRRIKKGKKIKVIALLDNVVPHEKRIGDKLFTRYFLQPIDCFVSMTQSVLDDLSLFNKNKPRILTPHPIFDNFGETVPRKEALQYLTLDENLKYILFFGLIRDYKGLDWLLKAYSKSKFKENTRLIIAGEYYEKKEKYDSLINELGLQDNVLSFSHFIPDSEVKYFFSVANLVVQPYKNATQSGVTQIGYQFDTPMIVTDVGGLGEMIKDGKVGFVVEPTIPSITKAIDTYFEQNLETAFKSNFEEEKKRFSWTYLTHSIYSVLKDT